MLPTEDIKDGFDEQEQKKALSLHVLGNAILHRIGRGIDLLHASRFQALDLFEEIELPLVTTQAIEALQKVDHHASLFLPEGPLLFLVENEKILPGHEVCILLLYPNGDTRVAALGYLLRSLSARVPWLTPPTVDLLKNLSSDCQSNEVSCWKQAGAEIIRAIRNDLYGHWAGLKQSIAARCQTGFKKYIRLVMRPSYDVLANLRPPLWSPCEQRESLKTEISQLAELPSLEEAFSTYISQYGYVPLFSDLASPELVTLWLAKNGESGMRWDQIWSWAEKHATPFAKYHALLIALKVQNLGQENCLGLIQSEVEQILKVGTNPSSNSWWELFTLLALHFQHHIEALHPGQDGERASCYARWLAYHVGQILETAEEVLGIPALEVVASELKVSGFRWHISRSPVEPSPLRYSTLYEIPIWAQSLLAHLKRGVIPQVADEIFKESREDIRQLYRNHLLGGLLSSTCMNSESIYAYQELWEGIEFWKKDEIIEKEMWGFPSSTASEIKDYFKIDVLKSRLDQLTKLPEHEQLILLYVIRLAVFSKKDYDDVIFTWLEEATTPVETILHLSLSPLERLLEILTEIQQRARPQWNIRLPHLLVYVIEHTEDPKRAEMLFLYALMMSMGTGVVSPIERAFASRWKSNFQPILMKWRENLAGIISQSDPWVSARIRATSAAISRLIGPWNPEDCAMNPSSDPSF